MEKRTQPLQRSKTFLHLDGDAFFVAVEIAKNPALRGLPVVTGEERGIVSALSYEAKALGVTRGMPIFKVKREFPTVRILPGDYRSYARYSAMMFDVVRRYADDVEEYSIDECFADLTGLSAPLKMSSRQIAERIKHEVTTELGLSVSVGVAPTKVLAKVASKWKKPNGLTVIELFGDLSARNFLPKVPIENIWGIGRQTSALLYRKGVRTAQDFADKDRAWVREHLSRPHEVLWYELNGVHIMEVDPRPKTLYGSIQKTRTFHPATNDPAFLLSQLSKHVEDACAKARHFDLAPRYVSIFLKAKVAGPTGRPGEAGFGTEGWGSRNFRYQYYHHRIELPTPTNAPEIINSLIAARENFERLHVAGVQYRTAGVTLHDLVPGAYTQGNLFGGNARSDKFEIIHKQLDFLERKFGKRVVHLASTHAAHIRDVQEEESGATDADDLDRCLVFL